MPTGGSRPRRRSSQGEWSPSVLPLPLPVLVIVALTTVAVMLTMAPATTTPPATSPPASPVTRTPPAMPLPAGSFPDASTTGVRPGTTLRLSGSIATSSDGQVIEDLDIAGSVRVQHDDVTIRNVRVRSAGQAISILDNTGLVVEDCELDGTGATDGASAIGDQNYTIRRCDVHHFGEGPRSNGQVTIEGNWFHDFVDFVSQGAHQDVVQITSGYGTTIRGNSMVIDVAGANASIMIGSYQGGDILVENNLLGGGGYTAYCGGSNGYTNVRFIDNRFSTAYYPRSGYHGPFVYCESATLSGNVWHDGPNAGQPAI